DEMLVPLLGKRLDGALEFLGLFTTREVALGREDGDRPHLAALQRGHPHPPAHPVTRGATRGRPVRTRVSSIPWWRSVRPAGSRAPCGSTSPRSPGHPSSGTPEPAR